MFACASMTVMGVRRSMSNAVDMRPIDLPAGRLEARWWGAPPEAAPTLVLLHEGLGSVGLWRDFPARLAAATGCGVFAYSRFGYGRSDSVALPRPLDYMRREALEVLPGVLDAAGVARVVLVGHSDGASIAASAPWPGAGRPGHACQCFCGALRRSVLNAIDNAQLTLHLV